MTVSLLKNLSYPDQLVKKLVENTDIRNPCFIYGETGKATFLKSVYPDTIFCDTREILEIKNLAGFYAIRNRDLIYTEGILVDAMKKGLKICFKKIDFNPNVLHFLRPVINSRRIVATNGDEIVANDNFRIFFTSKDIMDVRNVDFIGPIQFKYDEVIESFGFMKEMVSKMLLFIQTNRNAKCSIDKGIDCEGLCIKEDYNCDCHSNNFLCSRHFRLLIDLKSSIAKMSTQEKELNSSDRAIVCQIFTNLFLKHECKQLLEEFYIKVEPLTLPNMLLAKTAAVESAMRALITNIKLKKPTLLVGETGAGKTALIQYLCNHSQYFFGSHSSLKIINMSSDFDGTDLVGGYCSIDFDKRISELYHKARLEIPKCMSKRKIIETLIEKTNGDLLNEAKSLLLIINKKVPFFYKEGVLTRAMKEGSWILLDEINLSSDETLNLIEAILSKDEIILYESGDFTPLKVHPNFTIFACMNPFGDYGKKRYDTDVFNKIHFFDFSYRLKCITSVVQAVTKNQIEEVDKIAQFYFEFKSNISRKVFSNVIEPLVSGRTLCRALKIIMQLRDDKTKLLKAFNLLFFTQLDLSSRCQAINLFKKHFQYSSFANEFEELKNIDNFILTPKVKMHLADVDLAIKADIPVLLQGDTSTGKTSLIYALASKYGRKVVRINNHNQTESSDYIGNYTTTKEGIVFNHGPLVLAMKKGHWVILDELNLAPSDVLEVLNRLLDDNKELYIAETDELIKPHPNFKLFATQNLNYGGRNGLAKSFRNRFVEIFFYEKDEAEIKEILEKACKMPPSFIKFMMGVYSTLKTERSLNSLITLRDLFKWARRMPGSYYDLFEIGLDILLERQRSIEDKEKILQVFKSVFAERFAFEKKDFASIYFSNSYCFLAKDSADSENADFFFTNITKDLILTKSYVKLINLIYKAWSNHEPVLLIGETGIGKTKICEIVSTLFKIGLKSINVHNGTESSDFIGHSVLDKSEIIWRDGPLVEAMIHGDAFLIDEINLAEDSALERLNSVLEDSRSLFIPEIKKEIKANDTFQVIATMNPSGDFGKRELSPALRSRFTEIYFNLDEYEYRLIFNSLIDKINLNPLVSQGLKSRFSSLGDMSIRKVETICNHIANIVSEKPNKSQSNIFDVAVTNINDLDSIWNEVLELIGVRSTTSYDLIELSNGFRINPYTLTGRSEIVKQKYNFNTDTSRLNLQRIIRGLTLDKGILLQGEPGVGKTSLVQSIARSLNIPILRINLSEQTEMSDLVGTYLPIGDSIKFVESEMIEYIKKGFWIVLDEINLCTQSVIEGLNSILDYRKKIDVDGKTVEVHKDTRIFGTMNPFNTMNGRKNLPKSFLDRFIIIQMENYSESDIKSILMHSYGENYLFNKDLSLRGNIKLNEVSNLKDYSFDDMSVVNDNLNHQKESNKPNLVNNMTQTSNSDVDEISNSIANISLNPKTSSSTLNYVFDGDSKLGRFGYIEFAIRKLPTDYVIPHCQLAQIDILFRCILKRIPVIISGSSGRNALLRFISDLLELKLCVLECHRDTDVCDLLGQFQKNDFTSDSSALFSWKNSIIINSLKERSLVVFSTPELVDKTVFDRLNSLFESERFINIYEKGYDTFVAVNEFSRFVLLCDNPYLLSPALLDRCVTIDLSTNFDYIDLYKMFNKAPAMNYEKSKKFRSSLKENLFINFTELPVSIDHGSLDLAFKKYQVYNTLPIYLNKKIDIYNTIDESVIDSMFKIEPVSYLDFNQSILDIYKEISSYSTSLSHTFAERIANLVKKPYLSTLIKSFEFEQSGSFYHMNCKNIPDTWLGYKTLFIENLKTKKLDDIQDVLAFTQSFSQVKSVTAGYFDLAKFNSIIGDEDPLDLIRIEILNEKIKKENDIKMQISATAKRIYKYGRGDLKVLIDHYNEVSLSYVSKINEINKRLRRNYKKYKELVTNLTLCDYLNNSEIRLFLEDFSDINDYYLEHLFKNRNLCSRCACFSTEEIHSAKQCSLRMIRGVYKPEKLLKPEFSKYFYNKMVENQQSCNSLVVESLAFNDLHQNLLTDSLVSEYNQDLLEYTEEEIDNAIINLFPSKTRAMVIDSRSTSISMGLDIIPSLSFNLELSQIENLTKEKAYNKKILQSVAAMSIFSTPEQIINELQLIREQNETVVNLPLSDEYAIFVHTVKKLDQLETFFKNLYKKSTCLALIPNYSYFLYLYFTDLTIPTLENYFMNCTVYEFIDRLAMAESYLKINFSEVLYNTTLLFKSFEIEKLNQSKFNETKMKLFKEPKLYEQTISSYVDRFLYLPVLGILKVNFEAPICRHRSLKANNIPYNNEQSLCINDPLLSSLLESVPENICSCECERWIYLSKNLNRDLICSIFNKIGSLDQISSAFYQRKVDDMFSYSEICLAKLFNNVVSNANSSKYDDRTFKATLSCLYSAIYIKDVFFIYFAYKFSEFFEESDQLEEGVGLKSGQGQNNIEDKVDEDDICDDIDQNENQNNDSEGIDMDNEGDLQSVSAQEDENELESGVDNENIEQGKDESEDSDKRGEAGEESEPDLNQAEIQDEEAEDDITEEADDEDSTDIKEEDLSVEGSSEYNSELNSNNDSEFDEDEENSEIIQNEDKLQYTYEYKEAALNRNQTCASADGYDKKVEGGDLQEKDVLKEGDGEEYVDGEGEIGKEGKEISRSVTFNKISGDCTKLTNLLRIILESNKNNKYKGDFKSGKKLNLKKIVPYIASDYRKDKIWMKRTRSDKKDYKVRIFIDNSKSMFDQSLVNTLSAIFYKLESSFSLLNIPIQIYKFGNSVQECKIEDLTFNEDRTTLDWTDDFTDGINVILTDGVFQVVGSAKDNFLVVMIDKGNIKKMSKVNVIGNKVFVEKYLDSFALKYCVVQQVEDLEKVFIEALSGIFKNYLN